MCTMGNIFLSVVAIAFITVNASTHDGPTTNSEKALQVNCFLGLPSDKYNMPAEKMNPFLCDQVTFVSLRVEMNSETKELRLKNINQQDPDAKFIRAIIKRGRTGTKFFISVAGWNHWSGYTTNETYLQMISNSKALENVLTDVADFLKSFNLDGVNCFWDWNNPTYLYNEDMRYLALASKEICSRMHQEGKLCSVILQRPTWEWRLTSDKKVADPKELFLQIIKSMDNVTIWPADIWTPIVLPKDMLLRNTNSPPQKNYRFSVNWVVDYFKEIAANNTELLEKISLRITLESKTYGIQAGVEPTFGMKHNDHASIMNSYPYVEVCKRLAGRIIAEKLESITFENEYTFAYSKNFANKSGIMISHVTEETAVLMVEYAQENNFGGVSVYQIAMDDVHGLCSGKKFPITTKIFNTATNGPCVR